MTRDEAITIMANKFLELDELSWDAACDCYEGENAEYDSMGYDTAVQWAEELLDAIEEFISG